MKMKTGVRVVGNILMGYALFLFVLTAFFNGRQFGEDISIINYIFRMLLGFVPALLFAVLGIVCLGFTDLADVELNILETLLVSFFDIDLPVKSLLGRCVLASVGMHIGMILLTVVFKIVAVFFSILDIFL